MKPLKEATHIKHKEAENMLFNKKMFKGELTTDQYGWYLRSQLNIFKTIEDSNDDLFKLANKLNDDVTVFIFPNFRLTITKKKLFKSKKKFPNIPK